MEIWERHPASIYLTLTTTALPLKQWISIEPEAHWGSLIVELTKDCFHRATQWLRFNPESWVNLASLHKLGFQSTEMIIRNFSKI